MEKLIESVPNLAGVFALPISLFAVYLHWRTYRRDKADVIITDIEFQPLGRRGPCFKVTFVNSGRRPSYLEMACLRTKTGERHEAYFHAFSSEIPMAFKSPLEMTEGKKSSMPFDVYARESGPADSRSEVVINPIEVVAAEVVDTTGKRYKRKLTRRQRKEIARQWDEVRA